MSKRKVNSRISCKHTRAIKQRSRKKQVPGACPSLQICSNATWDNLPLYLQIMHLARITE